MEEPAKNNSTKVYCSRCDMIFESRKKFQSHLDVHSSDSSSSCEQCPIDTVIAKLVGLFRLRS